MHSAPGHTQGYRVSMHPPHLIPEVSMHPHPIPRMSLHTSTAFAPYTQGSPCMHVSTASAPHTQGSLCIRTLGLHVSMFCMHPPMQRSPCIHTPYPGVSMRIHCIFTPYPGVSMHPHPVPRSLYAFTASSPRT